MSLFPRKDRMWRKETAPSLKGSKPHLGEEKPPDGRTWQDEEETEFVAIQRAANSVFHWPGTKLGHKNTAERTLQVGQKFFREIIWFTFLFKLPPHPPPHPQSIFYFKHSFLNLRSFWSFWGAHYWKLRPSHLKHLSRAESCFLFLLR